VPARIPAGPRPSVPRRWGHRARCAARP